MEARATEVPPQHLRWEPVGACACVHVCVRACVRVSVVRACVRVRVVRACLMRMCVYARVCACVNHLRLHAPTSGSIAFGFDLASSCFFLFSASRFRT